MTDPNQDELLVALVSLTRKFREELRVLEGDAESDKDIISKAVAKLADIKKAVDARRVELGLAVTNSKGHAKTKSVKNKSMVRDVSILGLTVKKNENFADWYSQLVTKSELIEYYDISGCYILRPDAYDIWENIKIFLDSEIKKMGVRNCYFPMFISKAALCKESAHIDGFAPEVAWVTKGGDSDLKEHIAVRPTSETAMYPTFAKWIQGYRDLPLKFNQWASVVRWEFKSPTPFIRSREFLWQEGHTVFATREEAIDEMYQILDLYKQVYEDVLAVPVIKGHKTELEKFPGGEVTTTVECYIEQSGRAIQAATSHCLGQNFARMYKVQFENAQGERQFVWQNSWGLTTRSIGIMIMTHGDDKGLVLPPRVASKQVVIIPLEFNGIDSTGVMDKATELETYLTDVGVRVLIDKRKGFNPGFKHNHWELRGVPLRIEVGPRDVENNTCVIVRRDTFEKRTISTLSGSEFADECSIELDAMQCRMLASARAKRDASIAKVTEWVDFVPTLNARKMCLVPWCSLSECESDIKAHSGEEAKIDKPDTGLVPLSGAAKSLCIPLDQPDLTVEKCIKCGKSAKTWCLFGRSY